jgi:predicted aspartyl protease
MKFPYKLLASGIARPIIPIRVRNPRTQQAVRFLALVDSGADMTLLPGELAEVIGFDLAAGERKNVSGVVAGESRPYYVHPADIEVGGWWKKISVGFMPDLSSNNFGLLGQTGFFDRFKFVKFEYPKSTIELGAEL